MNLEDYAYNQDGRWYVDPQVALDEQNAFINNIRAEQAQNNAQIESQTRALGTQVPSQMGGLVGGGGYFRSRYQTPQTNQAIADLRATAQAQAMKQLLKNEVEKAKKAYSDAYRKATVSEKSQSPLYDANAEIKGDIEYNPIAQGNNDYWDKGTVNDDVAFYGVYQLRRNEGESQSDWDSRARKWVADMIVKYGKRETEEE